MLLTDPMERAMLEILGQPYPKKLMSDVMHVTTIKLPKTIWSKLDPVKTVTGRNQQELIAIAFIRLFESVQVGERFEDWEEETPHG